ncbi:SMI1/KNR4 family protein [Janthinobacterium lividum]|uniref:SMI1/KNR4 family protein n=1 Tax=Janthinobacterium lividum TaxID=29581 RepID=UPI0008745AC5|nr:SMI1/KNR4 family protein [Janthinobacterium lividum]MCC7716614.1 SMI1/KNR4 family protein [Janthinobacterium lividum]OEZ63463.1 SMI1 / KNR4 family protein [Janthinobacterium lividum]WQE30908.1 SMI1/KNR4 family protein [Janthinobacterium lividum]STQ96430.1 SMI1 / KNR4 family [Janthinobacterium lividum]
MTLSEIEQQHGFTYPSLYRQLESDGMLAVGEYGPDWYKLVYPTLTDRPTLLLHADDFELLNIQAVAAEVESLLDADDYRQIDPAFQFIPFAQTGAGDHYCFFASGQHDGEMPIVLLWHDQNEAQYLAKNLQDFLFHMLLNSMADQDTYNDVGDEEFKDQLAKTLGTHARYLTARQAEVLQTLLARDIIDYEVELPKGRTETHRGLLSNIELASLRAELIPYEKFDSCFAYSGAD